MSVFHDLNIKNPETQEIRVVLATAFHKAVKKHKLDLVKADAFNLANYGPLNLSLEKIAKIIRGNGFEIEYCIRLKKKGS